MTSAKEFVEFWLENSVHPDEQYGVRRGREQIQRLVENLITAAEDEGFTEGQMEAEIGGLFDFIRASIERQNEDEDKRLRKNRD